VLECENVTATTELKEPETPDAVTTDSEPAVQTADAKSVLEPVTVKPQTPPAPPVAEKATVARVPQLITATKSEYKKASSDPREAEKECRTLRRHVVSLNSELESAEAEILAQRTELERAAERMEKDRIRQKEEKVRLVTRHAEELKGLKTQHEQAIAELKRRSDQQLEEARVRMKDIEERRMQEGGDWTKEMENALRREQEAVRRMANLE
jgi:chromosome segregation ATPase